MCAVSDSRAPVISYTLLTSSSPAVQYDAAASLLALSGAPVAVKAAAGAYIKLLVRMFSIQVALSPLLTHLR